MLVCPPCLTSCLIKLLPWASISGRLGANTIYSKFKTICGPLFFLQKAESTNVNRRDKERSTGEGEVYKRHSKLAKTYKGI
jgi:hypothetical protein